MVPVPFSSHSRYQIDRLPLLSPFPVAVENARSILQQHFIRYIVHQLSIRNESLLKVPIRSNSISCRIAGQNKIVDSIASESLYTIFSFRRLLTLDIDLPLVLPSVKICSNLSRQNMEAPETPDSMAVTSQNRYPHHYI